MTARRQGASPAVDKMHLARVYDADLKGFFAILQALPPAGSRRDISFMTGSGGLSHLRSRDWRETGLSGPTRARTIHRRNTSASAGAWKPARIRLPRLGKDRSDRRHGAGPRLARGPVPARAPGTAAEPSPRHIPRPSVGFVRLTQAGGAGNVRPPDRISRRFRRGRPCLENRVCTLPAARQPSSISRRAPRSATSRRWRSMAPCAAASSVAASMSAGSRARCSPASAAPG